MTALRGCASINAMLRLTLGISLLLVAACTHERPVIQPVAATGKPAVHPESAIAAAAPGSTGAPPTRPAVNTDLIKQGYRTGLRHGQLVYCRTEQLTGSRFKTEVCLSEGQVLDEQKRAKDSITAPRSTRCLGPECT